MRGAERQDATMLVPVIVQGRMGAIVRHAQLQEGDGSEIARPSNNGTGGTQSYCRRLPADAAGEPGYIIPVEERDLDATTLGKRNGGGGV